MHQTSSLAQWASALLTAALATFVYVLSAEGQLQVPVAFIVLTVLLLSYLAFEINRLRRLHPVRWLANPAVLCSLLTFALSFGFTNGVYFMYEGTALAGTLGPGLNSYMNKMMLLVIIGACAMWLGYWSRFGVAIASTKALRKIQNRFFSTDAEPNTVALVGLLFISICSRIIQIQLGVYGYSGTYARFIELGNYTQYLNMGASLGKFALVVVALQFYSKFDRRSTFWFFGTLTLEILAGLLSGFKSAVGLPFAIVMLCQYIRTNRLSLHWILALFVSIMVAFAVIEPFRELRNIDPTFQGTTIENIGSTIIDSRGHTGGHFTVGDESSTLDNFMVRSNFTWVASEGIAFADEHKLPDDSPAFLSDLLLAPLHAWIPRLIWEDKPLGTLGLWYTREVVGGVSLSSTGMSPFTYLYFAGGVFGVVLGFLSVGILQRSLFLFTRPWASPAGASVYLAMFSVVITIDSAFNTVLITLFRELPLVLIVQALVFKRARPETAEARVRWAGGHS